MHSPRASKAGGTVAEPKTDWRRSVGVRWALGVVGTLGLLWGFVAWAMVSPVGGSPDDDYHLGSTWCPNPTEGGSCAVETAGGEVTAVVVPETIAKGMRCYVFDQTISAACADGFSDANLVPSERFDEGAYPPGFYAFQHLFVGPDVHSSVVNMRIANIALGLGGVLLVGFLAPPRRRNSILVASAVAWVPMGVYFIASNNPSGWAISGLMIFASAVLSAAESHGWRRWVLLVLGVLGAGMAMMARADSAFFVFVVALAIWFLLPFGRRLRPELILSAVLGFCGIAVLLSTTQTGNLTSDGGWPTHPDDSMIHIFTNNLMTLPEYIGAFWGVEWGPGWFDVPLRSASTLTMIVLFGALLFIGARELNWRKGLASLVLFGALVGVPVVSMTMRQVFPVFYYQGRYMLPLLGVFLLVWVQTVKRGKPILDAPLQQVLFWLIISVSNGFTLRNTFLRYASGLYNAYTPMGDAAWWPWSIPAKLVWGGGALAFAVGSGALLILTLLPHASQERPAVLSKVGTSGTQLELSQLKGLDNHEGNHSGRGVRHTPTPVDSRNLEATHAGLRQADDLLPTDDPDVGGNRRDHGDHNPA